MLVFDWSEHVSSDGAYAPGVVIGVAETIKEARNVIFTAAFNREQEFHKRVYRKSELDEDDLSHIHLRLGWLSVALGQQPKQHELPFGFSQEICWP